jgi:hypothetical protein
MKKAIWTLFVTLTLIWTAFAFLAAGLARWTSDAIASDLLAETTQYVANTSERVTQKLTDATGRVAERVTTTMTQAVGGETVGEQPTPMDGSTGAADAPVAPAPGSAILPPLPEWVNLWLAPEAVQSIKEWGAWAKSVATAGNAAVADAANESARVTPEALDEAAAQSVAMAGGAAAQAAQAADAAALQSAETHQKTDVAGVTWLSGVVGWLVPIVWVIWGIGLILGLLLTLIAQWAVSRFVGSSLLKPTSPH